MLADRPNIHLKQRGHQLLRQPDSLILHPHLNPVLPACRVKIRNSAVLLRI